MSSSDGHSDSEEDAGLEVDDLEVSEDCCNSECYPYYGCDGVVIAPSFDFDGDTVPNELDEDDDNDGVPDSVEHIPDIFGYTCCLNNRDSEGCPDGFDSDADGDTICDSAEAIYGTDRLEKNTDGDGLSDYNEIRFGFDPLVYDVELPGGEPYGDNWMFPRLRAWFPGPWSWAIYPYFLTTTVVARNDADLARLDIRELLPPMFGIEGRDLISEARIIGLSPPDGGEIADATTVTGLLAGTTVEVELTAIWPSEQPVPYCPVSYLLELTLRDSAGTLVSDEVQVVVISAMSLETTAVLPTHLCGLLPECPVRDW